MKNRFLTDHFFTARCAQDAKVAKGSKKEILTKWNII